MIKKKEIRCQYTKEGIETFNGQRLGYAKESNTEYCRVRWDGKKSWSRYSKTFIDTSPLIALYSDDEIKELAKEKEPIITPQAILSIENSLKQIKESGLSEKGLVILLREYIGASKINKKEIEAVLHALPRLKGFYLTSLDITNKNI